MTIRVLVADDEPVARQRIGRLLATFDQVDVVGEAEDGSECVRLIRTLWPDLVFLDIQMPKLSGFEVIEKVGIERMPLVSFVTAFEEHAIRAFEVNAIDYLLKPFTPGRFEETFHRAEARLRSEVQGERVRDLASLLLHAKSDLSSAPNGRVMVKSKGRIQFVDLSEVQWVEAAGNYVRLHLEKTTHLVRETLANLEAHLHPGDYVRIHRSALVNLAHVTEMSHWSSGEYQVVLRDGTKLKLSRTYRDKLLERVVGRT